MKEFILLTVITIKNVWFINRGFKFQNSVCNGCHDLMFCLNPSDIATITVKGVISKSEAIHLLANFVLDEMNIKEINIQRNQNRVYNYYLDYLIKVKKNRKKKHFN